MSRSPRSSRRSYVEHVPPALLPSDPNMYWRLGEEEGRLIARLTEAYKVTETAQSYIQLTTSRDLDGDQVHDIINQMAGDMLHFFASVPDFCALPPRDQAAALSFSAMPLFLLRNAFAASRDLDLSAGDQAAVSERHASHASHVSHVGSAAEQLTRQLCQFQRSLGPVLRNDVASAAILQCALLFDARAPDLWDRQTVNRLQDKYMILMSHHVESQCSYLFCWHYCEQMMTLARQARTLAAMVTSQFRGWKGIVDPLIDRVARAGEADV